MNKQMVLALAVVLSACGDDDKEPGDGTGDGEGGGASAGQVTGPWSEQCVATFSDDYEVIDTFGDVAFSASAGSKYLIGGFGTFSSSEGASVLYITGAGAEPFDIEAESGAELPFTSNCDESSAVTKLGVFADVTLYADEELTQELCTLEAGTITTGSLSYELVTDDLFASTLVYQVSASGLAELCDGSDTAYVEAGSATIQGVEYNPLPLANFASPSD